jgi:hypothetical protein
MAQSEQNYVVLVPFYGWYKQVTGNPMTTVQTLNRQT